MTHQLCTRGQCSYTLHCTLHSREGQSVPIKKVQNLKKKKKSLFFFFIIAGVRLCYERCPTVQEEQKFHPKEKQKETFQQIVQSNLQVTEGKKKKGKRGTLDVIPPCAKEEKTTKPLNLFFFPILRNTLSQKFLTPIPLLCFFQY